MKKILSLVAVAAIALFVASCTKSNGPGAVVEKAFNAMVNGDYKTFVDAAYYPDTISEAELEQGKQMAVQMLEKTMKNIKEGKDEEAKKNLPKSVKIVSEKEEGDKATVEVEITSEGGTTSTGTVELQKDKKGEWKMTNSEALQPKAAASGTGLEDAAEVAEDAAEAAEDVAEDVAEVAEDAADAAEDAVEGATE